MADEEQRVVSVDSTVRQSLLTGNWSALVTCLQQQQQVTDTRLDWALQMASERASQAELLHLIPYIPDPHLHPVLTECVKRGLWGCVTLLMTRGLTQQQQKWALSGASQRATGTDLERIVCHRCVERTLLDCVLPNLVKRDQWTVIRHLVPHHVTDQQRRWVLREAGKHASQSDLRWFVSHCADDQVDSVLSEAVKRQMWLVVGDLLKRPVSDKAKRRAVEEAMRHAADSEFSLIVCHCTDDQLEPALKATVSRHLWGVMERLLSRVVDDRQLQWAVVEAMKHADEELVSRLIGEYCDDLTLGPVLSEAVRRRLWTCVGDLLKHRVLDARRRWAVEEGSKHARETQLLTLLPHCADDQVDNVLREVVNRRMWDCALELLRRRVKDSLTGWVVEEASRHASEDKLRPFLRYCSQHVLYSVLLETARRGMWRTTNQLLRRHHDVHCVQAVMEEAADQLKTDCEVEMQKAVQCHAWTAVSKMLQHWTLSDQTRIWAVERVCRSGLYHSACGDGDFVTIVQHCDVTQLVMTLEVGVKRNMPHAVRDILTRIGQYGDPRSVTRNGQTLLVVVMETKECRRQLVAECIRLGVSTHQRDVTDFYVPPSRSGLTRPAILSMPGSNSPFERAIVSKDFHVVRMLYESGACSNKELHWLHRQFSRWSLQSGRFVLELGEMADYVGTKATTPRSLMSTCRLVISHHLGVGCTRQERVKQLPLPEPLRDYVLFSDIVNVGEDDVTLTDDVTHASDGADIVTEIAYELLDHQNQD